MLNQVQLSTYADCIGNNLEDLTSFLDTHIKGALGGATAAIVCCHYTPTAM